MFGYLFFRFFVFFRISSRLIGSIRRYDGGYLYDFDAGVFRQGFGLDYNHSVFASVAVDAHKRRVFEHRYRFDVVWIQSLDIVYFFLVDENDGAGFPEY